MDGQNRVIGLLAGNPGDSDWDLMAAEAADALEKARELCHFPAQKKEKRNRGNFHSLACGVSFGGGQKKPMNVKNTPRNQAVLNHLNGLRCFKRVSGFSTSRPRSFLLIIR